VNLVRRSWLVAEIEQAREMALALERCALDRTEQARKMAEGHRVVSEMAQVHTPAFLAFARLLSPRTALGVDKCRVGRVGDGGYVMLDALRQVTHAVSLGVGDDVSWDLALAEQGALVQQFDHTVAGPPAQHANFHFEPLRIVAVDTVLPGTTTLGRILDRLPIRAAHTRCVLKIDVEHDEWEIFDAMAPHHLSAFSQIVCEFHWFERIQDPVWRAQAERVLRKLNEHYQVVHVHANNNSSCLLINGVPFPSVLEVTYASRQHFRFGMRPDSFPTPWDSPNEARLPDIFLGDFQFTA
jgi:hypothetical protein